MTKDISTQPASLDDEFADFLFGIRRSSRYHRARMRFFDIWADAITVASVIGGTAAFSSILAKFPIEWALYFSAFVAVMQAIDLVFSPGKNARSHSNFARRYINLQQKSLTAEISLSDVKMAELVFERLEIELDEPSTRKWLSIKMHNELDLVEHKGAASPYKIPPVQSALMQYIDIYDVTKATREA